MKQCVDCGHRLRRQQPDNGEYGIPAVDGRRYPEQCPNCGVALS